MIQIYESEIIYLEIKKNFKYLNPDKINQKQDFSDYIDNCKDSVLKIIQKYFT